MRSFSIMNLRRLDECLRNTLCNDLNLCASCDKKEFFRIISKNNSEQLFSLFLPETNKNLALFRKNCRKLNLNKLGKVRGNHELICKRLGLKSGEILKNKSKIFVDED